MSLLTPEELEKLSGAEPSPQSPQQKEFEARVKDIGARLAKKVYGKSAQPVYEVLKDEATSLDKEINEKRGGDRSNLAYGYINKA
ncbi:MAG TPA: hypothetical protein VFZ84_23580 [Burkholderiales bacterium]